MIYTDEYVQKVLAATDITTLIKKYIPLKTVGCNLVGDCPFDKKSKDSLIVFPDKQVFKCFDCGTAGNAFVFYMKMEDLSIDEAVRQLASKAGIAPEQKDFKKDVDTVLKTQMYAACKDAAIFFMNKLTAEDGAEGMQYLSGKRGLEDSTIKKWGLGFAPKTGNALYKYMKTKGYNDDILIACGLIKMSDKGPYDFFRNRVMFPIIDTKKRVIAFSGRVLDDSKPKYLNSPESPIFNKGVNFYGMNFAKNSNAPFFLICEGQMDVISLHQAGFHSAIAPLGTAFTASHVPVIKSYPTKKTLILTQDSDSAGQKAIMRVIKAFKGENYNINVLNMEPAKDPDEFIKTFGVEEYKLRLESAIGATDYQVKQIMKQYNTDDPEQKKAGILNAVKLLIEEQPKKDYIKDFSRLQG